MKFVLAILTSTCFYGMSAAFFQSSQMMMNGDNGISCQMIDGTDEQCTVNINGKVTSGLDREEAQRLLNENGVSGQSMNSSMDSIQCDSVGPDGKVTCTVVKNGKVFRNLSRKQAEEMTAETRQKMAEIQEKISADGQRIRNNIKAQQIRMKQQMDAQMQRMNSMFTF